MAQEELSRKVELAWLMAFYGGMLTEKQRQALRLHCEEDMSLGEIAKETGVSRQGVHDMVKRSTRLLNEYEEKLHLVERFVDLRGKVGEIHKLTENEKEDPSMQKIGQIAAEILEEL